MMATSSSGRWERSAPQDAVGSPANEPPSTSTSSVPMPVSQPLSLSSIDLADLLSGEVVDAVAWVVKFCHEYCAPPASAEVFETVEIELRDAP